MFSKIWIINIFLMILIAITSVSIWDIWQKETGVIPDSIVGKIDTISSKKKSIARHGPQSKSEYDVIVDNNLFSSDRMADIQDVEEPLPETEEVVKVDGEKVVLYGVIMMNDYKKALINNPIRDKGNKEKLWIVEGDKIGNLNVKQIRAEQILLSDGINNYNVSLYDPKKQKTSKQKTSRSKSQKSKAPQVISAGDKTGSSSSKAESAKKKAERSRSAPSDSRRNIIETKDGRFQIIETPFGEIKKRIK